MNVLGGAKKIGDLDGRRIQPLVKRRMEVELFGLDLFPIQLEMKQFLMNYRGQVKARFPVFDSFHNAGSVTFGSLN